MNHSVEVNVSKDFKDIPKPPSGVTVALVRQYDNEGTPLSRIKVTGPTNTVKRWLGVAVGVKAPASQPPSKGKAQVRLQDYIASVYAVLRGSAFVSHKQSAETGEQSTSSLAWEFMEDPKRKPTAADTKEATDAIAWARGLTGDNEYEDGLKVACKDDILDDRKVGILASLPGAFERSRETGSDSQHVGQVGEELEDFEAKVVFVKSGEGQWGPWYLVKFMDSDGNAYATFPKEDPGLKKGDRIEVQKARVGSHDEFRGENQTTIRWCKMRKI